MICFISICLNRNTNGIEIGIGIGIGIGNGNGNGNENGNTNGLEIGIGIGIGIESEQRLPAELTARNLTSDLARLQLELLRVKQQRMSSLERIGMRE